MTMTKKHFERIAEAIGENSSNLEEAKRTIAIIKPALEDLSSKDRLGNPRFDSVLFYSKSIERFLT